MKQIVSEAYEEPSETSKMKLFVKNAETHELFPHKTTS